jgi:hypothetical protein
MRTFILLLLLTAPASADQTAYDKFVAKCAEMKAVAAATIPQGASAEDANKARMQQAAAKSFVGSQCSDWYLGQIKAATAWGRK